MNQHENFEGPESYLKYGFSVVRGALSPAEVLQTRASLDNLFKKGPYVNQRMLCTDELFKHPTLYRAIFRKPVVDGLKRCLGNNLVFMPNFDVQHNAYGIPGWHVDCGSETGNAYLYQPDYKFAKSGIYLQNYDNGWGGSICVKPASHQAFLASHPLYRYWLKAITRLQVKFDLNTFIVPLKAGDFCFFDSRLYHQSCAPSPANQKNFKKLGVNFYSVPEEHTKYVIYWDSCNAAMVPDHMQNNIKRAQAEEPNPDGKVGKEIFFTRNLSYYFPDDYPAEIVQLAKQLGITIASLQKADCDKYKKKLSAL